MFHWCRLEGIHILIPGSRSASFNLEAKSLTGWSTSRHCVITRFQDLTVDSYKMIKSKAGALLTMLPKNLKEQSQEDKQVWKDYCCKGYFYVVNCFLAFHAIGKCYDFSRCFNTCVLCEIFW